MLGSYGLLYSITADSVIFPDTLVNNFKPEVQFKNASSVVLGVSCGYTYTLVFAKNWFVNIATIPGISLQEFNSQNAITNEMYKRFSLGANLQTKLSIGYNKIRYFIGISGSFNNYAISGSETSSIDYGFGYFRFYYGHRFDLRSYLKKRM